MFKGWIRKALGKPAADNEPPQPPDGAIDMVPQVAPPTTTMSLPAEPVPLPPPPSVNDKPQRNQPENHMGKSSAAATSRDLFAKLETELTEKPIRARKAVSAEDDYGSDSIEVLEGLEPVRRRPGMYIGGTDEKALHHLFAEVIDNAMDEAVAGHATWIEVRYEADGYLSVTDNGRGIPVDPHPKFKTKSALEVVMTMLHSGGKFDSKVYNTSGGLHGVGVSVVNALSEVVEVEVARGQRLYKQTFSRGLPTSKLTDLGPVMNRRGTKVRFKPDAQIFKDGAHFKPARLLQHGAVEGVPVRWRRDPLVLRAGAASSPATRRRPKRCSTSPAACATSSMPRSTA